MKKDDLQMELSFRGMNTKGIRSCLITRLSGALDDEAEVEDETNEADGSALVLDPTSTYVLRVKGRTTQNSSGAGLGLVLYDPTNNRELWSGRIYVNGDRYASKSFDCRLDFVM
jgi:hypothetical protein